MQGLHIPVYIHVPGTLSANITSVFKAPIPMQLVKVSMVGSNANEAILTIGTTSSSAAYLAGTVIGQSDVPVEVERGDFVGGQFPVIPDDTVVKFALDYDGSSGSAAHDFTMLALFTEG